MKIQFVLFSVCLLATVPVWAQTQAGTAGRISKKNALPGDMGSIRVIRKLVRKMNFIDRFFSDLPQPDFNVKDHF